VTISSYNLELRDKEGFIGDRASKRAFSAKLDEWRDRLGKLDADPFGDVETAELSKKQLDRAMQGEDQEAAAVVHGAIEDFAQELAGVIRRFRRTKAWQNVTRIAVGGGFRNSRIGEFAIARTAILLKADGVGVDLKPIRHHPGRGRPDRRRPSHAGLDAVGARRDPRRRHRRHQHARRRRRAPHEEGQGPLEGRGLEVRALAPCRRRALAHRGHRQAGGHDRGPDRQGRQGGPEARPRHRHRLSRSHQAGRFAIDRGGQNLPGGNWESEHFNLPAALAKAIPEIGGHETFVVMHNDAVVQGLSEVPDMQDVAEWGVVTIGTGLGNATYVNRGKD
jgi:hypothetical protein